MSPKNDIIKLSLYILIFSHSEKLKEKEKLCPMRDAVKQIFLFFSKRISVHKYFHLYSQRSITPAIFYSILLRIFIVSNMYTCVRELSQDTITNMICALTTARTKIHRVSLSPAVVAVS